MRKESTVVYYEHSIFLAREHQQALLAEAAQDRLVQEALRNRHSASPRTHASRMRKTLRQASAVLGLMWLLGSRAG